MGADIHQFNIIYFKDNRPVVRDGLDGVTRMEKSAGGEVEYEVYDETYHSKYIPEFIPGRDSDMFAFMSGGRGEAAFKIYPEPGWPEWLDLPEQKAELEQLTKDRYGFCWYTAMDLLKQFKKAEHHIEWYMQVKAAKNPEYLKYGKVDEDEWMLEKVKKMIKDLTFKIEDCSEVDWNRTCICFNFDC